MQLVSLHLPGKLLFFLRTPLPGILPGLPYCNSPPHAPRATLCFPSQSPIKTHSVTLELGLVR